MVNSNLRGACRLQKRIRLPSHGDVTATSLMVDVYDTWWQMTEDKGPEKNGHEENERIKDYKTWTVKCWRLEIWICLNSLLFQPKHYLTFRLLMSYIYGAPSKARNANVVYIRTYVWQRWNSLFLFSAQFFNTESMQRGFLCHICV